MVSFFKDSWKDMKVGKVWTLNLSANPFDCSISISTKTISGFCSDNFLRTGVIALQPEHHFAPNLKITFRFVPIWLNASFSTSSKYTIIDPPKLEAKLGFEPKPEDYESPVQTVTLPRYENLIAYILYITLKIYLSSILFNYF